MPGWLAGKLLQGEHKMTHSTKMKLACDIKYFTKIQLFVDTKWAETEALSAFDCLKVTA